MRESYLSYAMSVIASRALPDVRDGLKPVQRRILFAMREMGMDPTKQHRKCAGIVGDVLKSYHPHGDSSVYDALVRIGARFHAALPAGRRPRQLRLDRSGLGRQPTDIRKRDSTGSRSSCSPTSIKKPFRSSPTSTTREPSRACCRARLPQLLINGSSGIAVGMATNIPPHNLGEISDAIAAIIDDRKRQRRRAVRHRQRPRLPDRRHDSGARSHSRSLQDRARFDRDSRYGRDHRGQRQVQDRHHRDPVSGLQEPHRGSDRRSARGEAHSGHRASRRSFESQGHERHRRAAEERDAESRAQPALQAHAAAVELRLQHAGARAGRRTARSTVRSRWSRASSRSSRCSSIFIAHRRDVVTRRTRYDLRKAEERAHLLEGYRIALDNIDEVIEIIRASQTTDEAKTKLSARFGLSDIQSQAIVDMRLRALVGLERKKIEDEYAELHQDHRRTARHLGQPAPHRSRSSRAETLEVKKKFADERRTRDRCRRRRDVDGAADSERGRRRDVHGRRLHQARLGRHVPHAESRRPRRHRHFEPQARGRRAQLLHDEDARSRALLHEQGARLSFARRTKFPIPRARRAERRSSTC